MFQFWNLKQIKCLVQQINNTLAAFHSCSDRPQKLFEFQKFERVKICLLSKTNANVNMTSCILAVHTCSYALDDPRILEWIAINKEQYEILGNGLAADFFPFLRHLPMPGNKALAVLFERYMGPIYKEIKDHRSKYDPG